MKKDTTKKDARKKYATKKDALYSVQKMQRTDVQSAYCGAHISPQDAGGGNCTVLQVQSNHEITEDIPCSWLKVIVLI